MSLFLLELTFTVSGLLYDELGDKVVDNFVNITVGIDKIVNVPVDANGRYNITHVLNNVGDYDIIVSFDTLSDYYFSSANVSSIVVNPRQTNMTIVNNPSVKLGNNISISGVLSDQLGKKNTK